MAITEVKHTIFDFFQLDLNNIPLDNFVKGRTTMNEHGDHIKYFNKSLDYKECGIFDNVEVVVIGTKCKNIFFKSQDAENVNMEDLKKLIDALYSIYKIDDKKKGKFSDTDIELYQNTEIIGAFRRDWMSSLKFKHPLRIIKNDNGIFLSLFEIKEIKKE